MSEKTREICTVVSQESIGAGIYSMWIQTDRIAADAKPGQFVSLYTNDKSKILPRPISLCEIDKENGRLHLVYRVTGQETGTDEFSQMKAGDTIPVLGPLGNGFPLDAVKGKKVFLMGGGIGIPPMLETAKQLDAEKIMVLGYRDELFLNKEFEIINHWLSFAEAKNAAIIALDTALLGILGRIIISEYVPKNNCLLILMVLILILITISLILALFSFLPKFDGNSFIIKMPNKISDFFKFDAGKKGKSCIEKNYIFYKNIANLENADEYLKLLKRDYNFNYFPNDQYISDMAQEIYINSKVAVLKFSYFRWSSTVLILALVVALCGFIITFCVA